MKNNSTSLSQAFKLYTGTNVAIFTLIMTIFSVLTSLLCCTIINLFATNFDNKDMQLCNLCIISLPCYFLSCIGIGCTHTEKKHGNVFFRTIKDCIIVYQKYHIGVVISSALVILFSHLIIGMALFCLKECVIIALILLFFRATTNILSIIKGEIVIILVFLSSCLPVFFISIMNSFEDKFLNAPFGIIHIILAVSAAVIFVVSEIIVLKHFRKNWYKD